MHEPVFGPAKQDVLAGACLYLQTSRWDALGISLCEAMLAGVPCAISATMDLAPAVTADDLGLVLPNEPGEAAAVIEAALADDDQLQARTVRAQRYAERFRTPDVAASLLTVYDAVVGAEPGGRPSPPTDGTRRDELTPPLPGPGGGTPRRRSRR